MARDKEIIAARNIKIKAAYHKLYEVKRLRYDDCLTTLSEEFFLTTSTIHRILIEKPKQDKNETGKK